MKHIITFIVTVSICIFAVLLFGQTGPSREEARTTCVTLVRLLDIAQRQHNAADSAALSQAYKIVRRYADSSDLKDDDRAMTIFNNSNPELADIYKVGIKTGGGGFTHRTIDEFSGLYTTDEHKAAIIVVDKNYNIKRFHSDMDPATVTNILSMTNGMHAISAGVK